MKIKFFSGMLGLLLIANISYSQKTPYTINHSTEFDDVEDLPLSQTNPYANGDVLLTFAKGEKLDKIGLQLFKPDLTSANVSSPNFKGLFDNKKSYFERVVVMNKKSYVIVREVFKETKTEGLAAVEFSQSSLDIIGQPIKLCESSRGIIGGGYGYGSYTSNDKTKLFYKYNLFNRERKNALNKEEFGFYMFDENMKQIWGGEYEMPYTEAQMSTLDYVVSNDGKLYYLISVRGAEGKEGRFEILVYSDKKDPKIIELKIDDYIARDTYLYEDKENNIVVAGFYSKLGNPSIDGAFMVKLDVANGKFAKLGGGYYEIPSELIKSFMTDRQKEKLEKKEKKNEGNDKKELGINNLEIKNIHFLDNGSTIIVSEIYYVVVTSHYNGKTTTYTYDTYANDIFVFSIDAKGNLGWIRKIPKRQHEGGSVGVGISFSSAVKGNRVHLFYLDHIENFSLSENEAPRTHQSRKGGFVAGIEISEKGEVTKHNLGEAEQFETNLYCRKFVDGRKNNLVAVERKKKKNMLFSIEIK